MNGAIKLVVGSIAVYLVMAACSAAERAIEAKGDGGTPTTTSDPVPSANADTPKVVTRTRLEVNTVKCNGTDQYATQDYPGLSAEELAEVRVILTETANPSAEYRVVGTPWVKDGSVRFVCSNISEVKFVRRVYE